MLQVYYSDAWSSHVHIELQQAEHCNQEAARLKLVSLRKSKILACLLTQKSNQAKQINFSSNNKYYHADTS